MKQRPKQHKVNNSKEQKSRYTSVFFALPDKTVDCNQKNASDMPRNNVRNNTKSTTVRNKRVVTLRLFFTLHHPHALLCNIPQFQTETPALACVCSNDCPPFADVSNLQTIFGVKLYVLHCPAKPLKIFCFPKVHGVVSTCVFRCVYKKA